MNDSGVHIDIATEASEDLLEGLARLIPQLSTAPPPSLDHLATIVAHDASTVLIARDDANEVLGTLTLATFPTLTGVRAWIEDVVVTAEARGRGIASLLVRRAIEIALEQGARSVDLTSRPSREDANRLYQKLGFVRRETNVYRMSLEK